MTDIDKQVDEAIERIWERLDGIRSTSGSQWVKWYQEDVGRLRAELIRLIEERDELEKVLDERDQTTIDALDKRDEALAWADRLFKATDGFLPQDFPVAEFRAWREQQS